jgi:hypothetical protein
MTLIAHPADFYIVHALFIGRAFPRGPVWGNLTDGPADRAEAFEAINEHTDDAPTLGNLRVFHFRDDAPARDVTEDFILEWEAAHAPTEDEMLEQIACDRADDHAHMLAEARA